VLIFQYRSFRQYGFTIIELVAVMTILALLATVGVVGVRRHYKTAREAVLKEDIFELNDCLNQYMADRGSYPTKIKELRDYGYVREIPVDPMTGSSDTWVAEFESPSPEDPDAEIGILRIRSGSTDTTVDGVPYSDW
jgi:general secretion pathway protein G